MTARFEKKDFREPNANVSKTRTGLAELRINMTNICHTEPEFQGSTGNSNVQRSVNALFGGIKIELDLLSYSSFHHGSPGEQKVGAPDGRLGFELMMKNLTPKAF
ncbi:MAG: hypothetical protein HW412_1255 [Bacteroidetes bacterium]|nr:hypothetical protein [Bacteroidota bacterium]